ncbi:H-NS histone family protein [Bradyrhizobium sp. Tv2a-2]|uniref:H-NS histone family protein n=1 Tax=Bradyrhizobium sp. Tv2a-2 TaxID=113395 RepID=UPI0005674B1C|nr:H-NS histone family protein [Bradyrhizobium sp. Tv2a-2]
MSKRDLRAMSVDELWNLHEQLIAELETKIGIEKANLEDRLRKISSNRGKEIGAQGRRRPYPKVLPKYRNPKNPDETWAGRGKQPRWLTTQLRSGKKLDDFLI